MLLLLLLLLPLLLLLVVGVGVGVAAVGKGTVTGSTHKGRHSSSSSSRYSSRGLRLYIRGGGVCLQTLLLLLLNAHIMAAVGVVVGGMRQRAGAL